MTVGLTIILFLVVGVCFLIVFLVKNVIIPRRAAAAGNYRDRSNVLKAIRLAKGAIERDPKNAEAHYLLGRAYLEDKREEQAFRAYRSASRLGIIGKNIPETEFRETLAALYAQFNEEEEALKEYILLIKKHPENPEYFYRAGKLFPSRNRPDLAEQYLRKAASLDPKNSSYRFELGMLHYTSKRLKEAGVNFAEALKIDPADAGALLYQGKVLKDLKEYAEAIPYFEAAAREQNYKLRSLIELGGCYMSLKMINRAIPELERAVNVILKEDDTESLYARYFLAMCYEKNREIGKAITQWDMIYAQKKNFKDVGVKLTQYIEYRTGMTDK